MSAASEKYERDVARHLNKALSTYTVTRPGGSMATSDVLLKDSRASKSAWIEVKMTHADNLANPRVYYEDQKWKTTYMSPAAHVAVDHLNKSNQARRFVADISKFTGIPTKTIKISTTKAGWKQPGAVPYHIMQMYFEKCATNKYIMQEDDVNLGKLVELHYTQGKSQPAHYLQTGDDFLLIGKADPLKLTAKHRNIPRIGGIGFLRVRVVIRTLPPVHYEVQVEIKIRDMPRSNYSIKPGTQKINPFL